MSDGPYDVYLTMLYVDQGMGHLVTVTPANTPGTIEFNALIDFGGASGKAKETIDFVYDAITNAGASNGKLDLITISHRDRDHWNLIPHLLRKLGAAGKTFGLGLLRYGDKQTAYDTISEYGTSILGKLQTYLNPMAPLNDYSSRSSAFSLSAALPDIYKGGIGNCLQIRPVAVNAPVFTGSEMSDLSTINNTPSLAVEVRYDTPNGSSVAFLPGDATADTLAYINEILDQDNSSELKVVRMLSIPHHGAVHSIADNYDSDFPDFKTAKYFASEVDPYSVGASAGFRTYRHPDERVLDLFRTYVQIVSKTHDYVSYFRSAGVWKTVTTQEMIFTNYVSGKEDLDPRSARRIVFKMAASGSMKVLILLPKGASIVTARRRVMAMPGGHVAMPADMAR